MNGGGTSDEARLEAIERRQERIEEEIRRLAAQVQQVRETLRSLGFQI